MTVGLTARKIHGLELWAEVLENALLISYATSAAKLMQVVLCKQTLDALQEILGVSIHNVPTNLHNNLTNNGRLSTLPLTNPPTDLSAISQIDSSILFSTFTAADAWTLGCLLRSRLSTFASPTVISITLANNTPLFYTAVKSGVTPDNSAWVARKSATVLRFGASTWYMHNKFAGDEKAFAEKYCLLDKAKEFAIHGGGFPVRVKGVEGVVAVIVVSGLKQQQDHQIIVQTCRDFLDGVGEGDEKRKED
ncbi:unnamed protein product [Aureobasidium vineae]|uniref:DUF967 domain protein n=1 Tax=Aureobasidium vineae TaxID=2773715 RepID=A0A9N8PCI1_9PEZI|nr:unnamed protein product [Aureobasidium vineae]